MARPQPATDIRDNQVIKHDQSFFLSDRFGDVPAPFGGADGVPRSTTIRFSPVPDELDEANAAFGWELEPGGKAASQLEVIPEVGEPDGTRLGFRDTREQLERGYRQWRRRCTRVRTTNAQLSMFLDRAILDLRMLLSRDDQGGQYLDAGMPWLSALFGRDSIITAYECLGVNPELGWGVLKRLASLRGTEEDEWREEEPGKILHEVRVGELGGAGEVPHTPYFGSIDAAPLWLTLLTYAYAWTGDLTAVRALWPNALAALRWIDEYGDLDGDGYVEYRKRSPRGLDNQGWKDSWNAIVHPDGTLAKGPIALVDIQGYVYQAKSRLAPVARALGEDDVADRLEKEAAEVKEHFDRDFWLDQERYYALALDGDKERVPTITSNPGQVPVGPDRRQGTGAARGPEAPALHGRRVLSVGPRPRAVLRLLARIGAASSGIPGGLPPPGVGERRATVDAAVVWWRERRRTRWRAQHRAAGAAALARPHREHRDARGPGGGWT